MIGRNSIVKSAVNLSQREIFRP